MCDTNATDFIYVVNIARDQNIVYQIFLETELKFHLSYCRLL